MTRTLGWILLAAMAAAFAVELVVALGAAGPTTFGDEYIYVANARAMLGGPETYSPHYPPLYPAVLMPAMLFGDRFYEALLVINTVVSSLVLLPMWLLARRMFSPLWSLSLLLAGSLLPLQFVYGQLILSENVFCTTFLFAAYFFLRMLEERRARFAVGLGVSIAGCLMARYFTLVWLPVLVSMWVGYGAVAVIRRQERWAPWLTQAGIAIGAAAVAWSPWMIAGLVQGWPFRRLLGLTTATSALGPEASPATSFLEWALLYGGYVILMIAPVLVMVLLTNVKRLRSSEQPTDRRTLDFAILLLLSTAAFAMVAAHHSWKSPYNAELPRYILGRYLVHLLPMWLVGAFAVAARVPQLGQSPTRLIAAGFGSCGLIALAYLAVIRGAFVEITPWFVSHRAGLDAQVFRAGPAVPILVCAASLVLLGIIWRAPRAARGVFLAIVCTFYGYASFYGESAVPISGRHGRELARVVRERELLGPEDAHLTVVNALENRSYRSTSLTYSLRFWGLHRKNFTIVDETPAESALPELVLSDVALADEGLEQVGQYDGRYRIYLRRAPRTPRRE